MKGGREGEREREERVRERRAVHLPSLSLIVSWAQPVGA
jgi:hypothetical protein